MICSATMGKSLDERVRHFAAMRGVQNERMALNSSRGRRPVGEIDLGATAFCLKRGGLVGFALPAIAGRFGIESSTLSRLDLLGMIC